MITLVGSGNVATWIAQRLQGNLRFPITQVYSRKMENAQMLAELLNAEAIADIRKLSPDNQIFVFALADNAYADILPQLPFTLPASFMTSGTVSCRCLAEHSDVYGVIYPLQTFTKSQEMSDLKVPLCLESDFAGDHKALMWELARQLSPNCYEVSEVQRARLHLAAVFASNFSNAMYHVAYKLLEEKDLPFEMLMPLLYQTVRKLEDLTPAESQTGPAIRRDMNVMRKQLESLEDPKWKELYQRISELIMEF